MEFYSSLHVVRSEDELSSYELLRIERMKENRAVFKRLFEETDIDVSLQFLYCGRRKVYL